MAWYVTDGKTRKEIAETLSLPKGVNDSDLLEAVGMSLDDFQTNGRVNISSANRMYLFGNFAYSKRLSDELQKSLHIGMLQYNKTVQPEKARLKINNWVADKTDGLLTDLLPLGIINQDTRLILATALYFTGSWEEKFDRSLTKDTDFFLLKGGTTKVPLMYREDLFKICAMDRLDAKVLKLPFADDRWDLFIILPKGKSDLPKLMQRYAKGVGFNDIVSCGFREKTVGLYLPRFVLGTTTHVNATKIVQSLGIIEMFTKKANFSRLTSSPNVTASGVIHRSVMKVRGCIFSNMVG
ncbi:hypothetical protein EG68_05635 [Paragonimus skrjabini miyazakii]|uniref:Serpin domain-containing protein n=1 Tax=Paragonimus skrjabini miyazakii TaxID=59628 RepID=A0A8S9YSQ0_9TREM|nr:hypothetical protein EG68_05635 [Paragonimus skrjabini miyazakii]